MGCNADSAAIVETGTMVTILGGGATAPGALEAALARAPVLVAADAGADRAVAEGHDPAAVIGDFDSIRPETRSRLAPERLHHIAEQESTDFDKCLRNVAAPVCLGVGVTGARLDHELAAFSTLVRHPGRRCVLIGSDDVVFLAPPAMALRLEAGTRVSLFPMGAVSGESRGLRWPIGGIAFDPAGAIGTSNAAAAGEVAMRFDAPRMLAILPVGCLDPVLSALAAAPGWPAG